MLRVNDARTGSMVPLARAGGRGVRVGRCGCAPGPVVVADLVRRLGELRRLRVTVHHIPCPGEESPIDPMPWNAHPPVPGPPDGPLDVYVGPAPPPGEPPRAHVARDASAVALTSRDGADAYLTARLTLLTGPFPGAAEALADVRRRTAILAETPSAAPPAARVAEVIEALEDDLAAARAWELLTRLTADDEVPAGARFEAVAFLDQVFGLDLARDVGRI